MTVRDNEKRREEEEAERERTEKAKHEGERVGARQSAEQKEKAEKAATDVSEVDEHGHSYSDSGDPHENASVSPPNDEFGNPYPLDDDGNPIVAPIVLDDPSWSDEERERHHREASEEQAKLRGAEKSEKASRS